MYRLPNRGRAKRRPPGHDSEPAVEATSDPLPAPAPEIVFELPAPSEPVSESRPGDRDGRAHAPA